RHQVDRDVMHARRNARAAGTVQRKAVGGRQQDFKEHEQVEQVAREECAVQTHEQELKERMKMHASTVPTRGGVCPRSQAKQGRQHQHDGRKPVDYCNNAEGRGPVAQKVDTYAIWPAAGQVTGGNAEQGDGCRELANDGDGAQRYPAATVSIAHQQHQGPEDQRNDDGQNGKMLHPACHFFISLPSTWSVPLKPREANSTTRNNAVVANAMTIAVSTSACGSGSA